MADSSNLTVITNSTSNNNLEYNSDGTTNESGGTARFAVCDKRGGAWGRQINVPPHGRPKFIKGDSANPSPAFDMLGTINLARTEAVKRRTRVVLCRSADPTLATPSCGGSANTWTTGWLVFASGDSNNTYQAGTDTLLGIGLADSSNLTVITNSTRRLACQSGEFYLACG